MTVTELVDLLATYPGDAELSILSMTRSGQMIDTNPTQLATTDADVDDTGTVRHVWLVGWRDTIPPPALVEVPCVCGAIIVVDPDGPWPASHDHHT